MTMGYALVVGSLASVAAGSVMDLLDQRAAVTTAADLLARLQSRHAQPAEPTGLPADLPAGSPFLEGPTVTVAGAALMQRVSGAVAKLDGRITSSQVELPGTELGNDFVGVTASVELAQPDLQKLLYDLEAGIPFLFVDQLVAQRPAGLDEPDDGRLQVRLTVYGQWQGGK